MEGIPFVVVVRNYRHFEWDIIGFICVHFGPPRLFEALDVLNIFRIFLLSIVHFSGMNV